VLQGCYKNVLSVLQKCYKGVTRVLQGCYNGATRVLQRTAYLAGASPIESVKGVNKVRSVNLAG
jgi:hypothetical protein